MRRTYLLSPRFDRRKSFYGKARVREEEGKRILQSYQTDVAEIVNGKAIVRGTYSPTTLRHIKEFLKQEGFRAETKQQIIKDFGRKVAPQSNGMLKTTAMVAKMGDIFGKNVKESNVWKQRMLKAGLSNRGLMIPKDFNKLSEKEKKKRLDKAIGAIS